MHIDLWELDRTVRRNCDIELWPLDTDGAFTLTIQHDTPVQAWVEGYEDEYTSEIIFAPTRAGWESAWRIARLLSGAHKGRRAQIAHSDAERVYQVGVAPRLGLQAFDLTAPDPLRYRHEKPLPGTVRGLLTA